MTIHMLPTPGLTTLVKELTASTSVMQSPLYELNILKSNVKLGGFQSQLKASCVSNHTDVLWYNETICLYIYIYISSIKLIVQSSLGLSHTIHSYYLMLLWRLVDIILGPYKVMKISAGRPILACLCAGVHKRTWLEVVFAFLVVPHISCSFCLNCFWDER